MNRFALASVVASITLVAVGCEESPSPASQPAPVAPASMPEAGHGHDHGPEADHAHDAPASITHDLGSVTIAGYTLAVTQTSTVTPGEEADFALVISGGDGRPDAVRLWIGIESAEGSTKVRTHRHGSKMEAHVEVPNPLPAGAQLWVEVETDAGRAHAPLALK